MNDEYYKKNEEELEVNIEEELIKKEIEHEKKYKPSEEWLKSLILINTKNVYNFIPKIIKK